MFLRDKNVKTKGWNTIGRTGKKNKGFFFTKYSVFSHKEIFHKRELVFKQVTKLRAQVLSN